MKTYTIKKNREASAPASVRPSSVSKGKEPRLNFALRHRNRQMPTERLLQTLHEQQPGFFGIARVVGKWVWIQFTGKQPREITFALSQLGFHWNNRRQLWQHPCGIFCERGADYDPRKRYGDHGTITAA